tara:strand:- start:14743 stop:16959 length:2217 start_codon:yes stop_codon:yes gene_type:complete
MTYYFSILITSLLIAFSTPILAISLLDAEIPEPLKKAYNGRYTTPYVCIETTTRYIKTERPFYENASVATDKASPLIQNNLLAEQLLAFCYAQIEDYQQAYQLLTNLLKEQKFSLQQLRTLNILASEIPEEKRLQFNNQTLIKRLTINLQKIDIPPFLGNAEIKTKLLLTITKLSLESNQYRNAYIALESVKELLKNYKNRELDAWLFYYYGLYFEKINQEQLAISNLFSANELAEKYQLIKLNSEAKKSIANLYQQKYLFKRAINIAKQRVELYINTENRIKQADSLIQLAILNDKNNEKNNALIYLFNALELIQKDKHSSLLAHVYLELGRTYSHYLTGRFVTNEDHQKERLLAQKYLQNARYHFTRLGEVHYQIESLLLLAHLNINTENPALAILQLEKVLDLAQDNYPTLRVQAFDMLASSYEITGNHQQAILHFKNFHALQNNIKEHLFSLQQLQINEQLQLIEMTQQQRQLELENSELQSTKTTFKMLTYGTLIVLFISLFLLIFVIIRNKKLSKSNQKIEHQLTFHPRTLLPSQQTQGHHFNYVYNDEPLYYALVNIPFLTQLNELSGLFSGSKLEKRLGIALMRFFASKADIFQIRDNQVLLIGKQKDYMSANNMAQNITLFFDNFIEKYHLPVGISIGIVAFPFLNNVSRAITPTRMVNLSSLALFGASQLRHKYQENSWLELYAIDNLQPAFFDGDLWVLGQKAIKKGVVKVNSSHPTHQFIWPELDK